MATVTTVDDLIVALDDEDTVNKAKVVKTLHEKLVAAEAELAAAKADLVSSVKDTHEEAADQSKLFSRNYKIDSGMGVVQVEAKFIKSAGTLDIAQEKDIDDVFGAATDSLFGKNMVLSSVTDKRAVLKTIVDNPAFNLNDIEISIKNPAVLKFLKENTTGALTVTEVIVPKDKFLETLAGLPEVIRIKTFPFVKKYLEKVIRFDVVCGNRGKKA